MNQEKDHHIIELYETNKESCGYAGRKLVFRCEEIEAKKAKKAE